MSKMLQSGIVLLALFCFLNVAKAQQTFVRVDDNKVIKYNSTQGNSPHANIVSTDSICNLFWNAQYGQTAPNTNGGTLSPVAFMNSTTINSSGRVAFYSGVEGSTRNQGIFVGDTNGVVHAIAIGSGLPGGGGDTVSLDGDPSPIGGKFSGFFAGTIFTPDINNAGDVLFFADVNGGSSRRGLFLYKAATQQIIKIAAVGDPSPIGGTFGAVSAGSLNNNGKVVFLAAPVGSLNSNILLWDNNVVTKVAAIGDPAPGGGTFALLGTESYGFQDGTNIPGGPLPDINDLDQIVFRGIISGGIAERGLFVRTGNSIEWYVKAAEPTPAGGTFLDMQAASINNSGEIAFFADFKPTPTTYSTGWFAGSKGNLRKVIAAFDDLDGGKVYGMAFSRNPMQMIDEQGNVVLWVDINSSGGADRMVISLRNGNYLIAARRGSPSPNGGTFGSMNAWPSSNGYRGTVSSATPGGTGMNAHMVFARCPEVPVELVSFTASLNGASVNLNWSTATETNNRGFEVQKSSGNEFVTIAFINGHGTSTESNSYSFTDKNLTTGTYTYRLKQFDFNGGFEYSPMVNVDFTIPQKYALEQNYPNPFNPTTNIKFAIKEKQFVKVNIYDVLGNEVAKLVNEEKPAGEYNIEFNAGNLSSGIYFYSITTGHFSQTRKMVLMK